LTTVPSFSRKISVAWPSICERMRVSLAALSSPFSRTVMSIGPREIVRRSGAWLPSALGVEESESQAARRPSARRRPEAGRAAQAPRLRGWLDMG
jgi:hypothetical protein